MLQPTPIRSIVSEAQPDVVFEYGCLGDGEVCGLGRRSRKAYR